MTAATFRLLRPAVLGAATDATRTTGTTTAAGRHNYPTPTPGVPAAGIAAALLEAPLVA